MTNSIINEGVAAAQNKYVTNQEQVNPYPDGSVNNRLWLIGYFFESYKIKHKSEKPGRYIVITCNSELVGVYSDYSEALRSQYIQTCIGDEADLIDLDYLHSSTCVNLSDAVGTL